MNIIFKPAVKQEAKLRLAIAGPSGSGKTFTALAVATHLAPGGRIALVDTEHGSASKYGDVFRFDTLDLTPPFHPDRFVEVIKAAAAAGYDVLILDSLTHAWAGQGGLLEIVDEIAARMKTSNTFAAWKDATPIQNRLVEAILGANIHIIATIRSKQDYVQEKDEKGKTIIRKVGMAPQQREGFEYEFDIFTEMDIDNRMIVSKSRCLDLAGRVFVKPGKEVAAILRKWLAGAPAPVQPPTPASAATTPPPAAPAGPTPEQIAASDKAFEETGPSQGAELSAARSAQAAQAAILAETKTGVPIAQGATPLTAARTKRPMTAGNAIAALHRGAEYYKQHADRIELNGRYNAALGLIDHIRSDFDHHRFFAALWEIKSAKDLPAEMRMAFSAWAGAHRPAEGQPYVLPDYVVTEYNAIADAILHPDPADDPDHLFS